MPPKLVAPISKNARKIRPTDALFGEPTLNGFGVMTVSFVALRRVAIKAIDGSGLGGSERDPVAPDRLEGREELLAPFHRPGVQLVPALELALE